ncbi:unnamed protein product [Ascophyllum nodosum]
MKRREQAMMSRKRESSPIFLRSKALRGVPCRQARSMTLPENRSPMASKNLKSSSTTYSHHGTALKPAKPRRASKLAATTGRRGSKSMIPYSMKSSADVQVEILSDDKLKSLRKNASGATLRTACLS